MKAISMLRSRKSGASGLKKSASKTSSVPSDVKAARHELLRGVQAKVKARVKAAAVQIRKTAAAQISQVVASRATLARKSASMLTMAQIRDLEKRLRSLQTELKSTLESKQSLFNVNESTESLTKGDDAEVAEKQRMNNAALQELDILKNRIKLIQRALLKIPQGGYGICEETEEPIGFERLSVVPWARFAVHVQEIKERNLRDYKVSRLRTEG
jgi:DnaK suppressor protein